MSDGCIARHTQQPTNFLRSMAMIYMKFCATIANCTLMILVNCHAMVFIYSKTKLKF